jgi:predicted ATPase/DNA-binding SARP family transcriptional activator
VQFGVLGSTRVWDASGRQLPVGGPRVRALLARLLLAAGELVTTARLIDDLYGADPPANPANALQAQVSRLRRVLPADAVVEFHPAGYRLAVESDQVDAHRFTRQAGEGRQALAGGDPAEAVRLLTDALDLWRGPALVDVVDAPFAAAAATRLSELRVEAVCDRSEARLRLGEAAALIDELFGLVNEHPLRERPRALLMRALATAGRSAEALESFEQGRRLLADELGADPSAELSRLHVAILRGELTPLPLSVSDPAPSGQPSPTVAPAPGLPLPPAPLTSFIGRERELARLRTLLTDARLVTVTGPGGAGKTRLAVEAVRDRERKLCFVDFSPLVGELTAAELAAVVGTALGLRDTALRVSGGPGPEPLDRLVRVLAGRQLLLVVDNCEHVVAATAELASRLLSACPDLQILATSREPLGLTGEVLLPVSGLSLPPEGTDPADLPTYPAVRLFLDRAAEQAPYEQPAPELVAHICRTLDGIPLAIELAAARLRSLPTAELATRLADRFGVLSRGSRTAAPRHQTLRAVVGWSWELLTEPEQVLARRLTGFAGGATLAAIEQVVGVPSGDLLDLLTGLVDKSLVEVGGGRYRMLETVRAYGAEQLEQAGETESIRRAHAAYFLTLARTADSRLRRADQLTWMSVLDAERDNLHAALLRAIEAGDSATALKLVSALSMYWWLRGQRAEAVRLAKRALAAAGPQPPAELQEEYVLGALLANLDAAADGELAPVANWTQWGGLERFSHPPRQPFLFYLSAVSSGPPPIDIAEQAALHERLLSQDPWGRALTQLGQGMLRLWRRELNEAGRYLTGALSGLRQLGERWGTMLTLSALAELAEQRGDHPTALATLDQALELAGVLGSEVDRAELLRIRADNRLRVGDSAGAAADYTEAVACGLRAGAPELTAAARRGLAELARRRSDWATAQKLVEQALAECPAGWFGADTIRIDLLTLRAELAEAGGEPATGWRAEAAELAAAYHLEGWSADGQ